MKRIKLFIFNFIVLLLVLPLFACGGSQTYKTVMIGKNITSSMGYYSLDYTRFSGTEEIEIYVDADKNIEIDVVTFIGRLDVEIFGSDADNVETSLYYGENVPTSSSEIFLKEGTYRVVIYGTNHTGGISIEY